MLSGNSIGNILIDDIIKLSMQGVRIMNDVEQNMFEFWHSHARSLIDKYHGKLSMPTGIVLPASQLDEKISQSEIIVLTANTIESKVVTQQFMYYAGNSAVEKIVADSQTYQFFSFKGHRIMHIIPQRTSSFVENGAAGALRAAFRHYDRAKQKPKAIFSIGVAYGINPKTSANENDKNVQDIGDVLVSERLIQWGNFAKLTDGKLILNDHDFPYIGNEILAGCRLYLNERNYPQKTGVMLGEYKWFLGTLLTGGFVLSDEEFRQKLLDASKMYGIKNIIGGEMEGSGILYEGNDIGVPSLIIKGICDWGVNKNGWSFLPEDSITNDEFKDCVQAYACENAFKTFSFIISQVYGENDSA